MEGSFFMSKYTFEFKLKVVEYQLNEGCGMKSTAKHFDIPSKELVRQWVKEYENHGIQGLFKNQKSSYDGKFKQDVIEYMHKNHLSAVETAYRFNLGNNHVVSKWEHIYNEEGPQALYQERRGRRKNMSSKKDKKELSKKVKEELIEEVQRLRMENEYLKKLNALVQERIKRENKKK